MTIFQIYLTSMDDVVYLVEHANKHDGEITLSKGRFIVNAKSFLGVMAIGYPAEARLTFYDEDVELEERLHPLKYQAV